MEWISVKDRLPELYGGYIVNIFFDGKNYVREVMFIGEWYVLDIPEPLPEYFEVTHWMTLPDPPKDHD